jgi:hypothetical protein
MLISASSEEVSMESSLFPAVPCTICAKPVDLTVDLCADENGSAVHEKCYIKHITGSYGNSRASVMAN